MSLGPDTIKTSLRSEARWLRTSPMRPLWRSYRTHQSAVGALRDLHAIDDWQMNAMDKDTDAILIQRSGFDGDHRFVVTNWSTVFARASGGESLHICEYLGPNVPCTVMFVVTYDRMLNPDTDPQQTLGNHLSLWSEFHAEERIQFPRLGDLSLDCLRQLDSSSQFSNTFRFCIRSGTLPWAFASVQDRDVYTKHYLVFLRRRLSAKDARARSLRVNNGTGRQWAVQFNHDHHKLDARYAPWAVQFNHDHHKLDARYAPISAPLPQMADYDMDGTWLSELVTYPLPGRVLVRMRPQLPPLEDGSAADSDEQIDPDEQGSAADSDEQIDPDVRATVCRGRLYRVHYVQQEQGSDADPDEHPVSDQEDGNAASVQQTVSDQEDGSDADHAEQPVSNEDGCITDSELSASELNESESASRVDVAAAAAAVTTSYVPTQDLPNATPARYFLRKRPYDAV